MSMAQYFDHRFGDPFILKREMPGTNGEEVNTKFLLFINATSASRAAYTLIMNHSTKIYVIYYAECSKLDVTDG